MRKLSSARCLDWWWPAWNKEMCEYEQWRCNRIHSLRWQYDPYLPSTKFLRPPIQQMGTWIQFWWCSCPISMAMTFSLYAFSGAQMGTISANPILEGSDSPPFGQLVHGMCTTNSVCLQLPKHNATQLTPAEAMCSRIKEIRVFRLHRRRPWEEQVNFFDYDITPFTSLGFVNGTSKSSGDSPTPKLIRECEKGTVTFVIVVLLQGIKWRHFRGFWLAVNNKP